MNKISKDGIQLQINILKEGDHYIAHSPALDLSSCGRTLEEVKLNFKRAVDLFFKELKEMGTTDEVLLELGWRRNDARKHSWIPPHLLQSQVKINLPKIA